VNKTRFLALAAFSCVSYAFAWGRRVLFCGTALTPGLAGVYQVAIQVPGSLAGGNYSPVATVNGVSSPAVSFGVQ